MSKEAQSVPIVTLAGVANIGDCKYICVGANISITDLIVFE